MTRHHGLSGLLALTLSALGAAAVHAQDQQPEASTRTSWDATAARGDTRLISFTTDEGSSLSIDVAPDGWIVFDLLGHIWRLPAEGGAAQSLTQSSGVALNYHPSVSPDGRLIAFVSDRTGQNNLWVMNADGTDPRIVHRDDNARMLTPTWTPDAEYIVVRRQPSGPGASSNAGGLWMLHRDGGQGVQILDDNSAHWPSVSSDGRYVYYHVRSASPSSSAAASTTTRIA